jgi:DNA topoisomerase VI subunit B
MPAGSRAKLTRETFSTSRLLEFCSRKELINQTGHGVEEWPLVILKELVDNAIDACEEAEVAPHITVTVRGGHIIVTDNGPGVRADVVPKILDYNVRVSSREAYVSPTRGAQGNALKTILAMPFALDGTKGETLIEARGVAHRITFAVDHVRQEPKIEHVQAVSVVKNGTRITAPWPVSAFAQTPWRPGIDFYKLPRASAGSTPTSRWRSTGRASSLGLAQPTRPGASGAPPILPLRIGTTPTASSG